MIRQMIVALLCAVVGIVPLYAQSKNDNADSIVGEYLTDRGGSKSKVRVFKETNGTYTAQVFWVEHPYDKNGEKRKDVKNPDEIEHITNTRFIICSIICGVLFAALNYLTDIAAGAVNSSWRLCSILGVSTERETLFYIVFTIFMFMAGILLPLWNRCCLPKKASISASIIFALEISLFVWLPNVLIMAFFGTPFMLTIAYGIAYVFMIMICVLVYRKISDAFYM